MTATATHSRHNRSRYFNPTKFPPQTIKEITDDSVDRLFIHWPSAGTIEVRYFEKDQSPNCYQSWLALPKGTRAAMRNAGDSLDLYWHDFVDAL